MATLILIIYYLSKYLSRNIGRFLEIQVAVSASNTCVCTRQCFYLSYFLVLRRNFSRTISRLALCLNLLVTQLLLFKWLLLPPTQTGLFHIKMYQHHCRSQLFFIAVQIPGFIENIFLPQNYSFTVLQI